MPGQVSSPASRVVVIGGGLGGLATALRLAKLGDDVTLVEAHDRVGGALSDIEADGFAWPTGPSATLLPAVLRDLFAKTGRPLDRELDLEPLDCVREHRFADGSSLRLPGGSRAGQVAAVEALGDGLGRRWAAYVDQYADVWDTVRRGYAEPWETLPGQHAGWIADRQTGRPPGAATTAFDRLVRGRRSLARQARELPDARLRDVALQPAIAGGHDPRRVPAWCGLTAYLEQRFGAWTVPGGLARVSEVLGARLRTRGVTVLTGTRVTDLVVRGDRVHGVRTHAVAEIAADAVVCAVDPRTLPALAGTVRPAPSAAPPWVTHLAVADPPADLAAEIVLPDGVVLHTTGRAPAGHGAWTLHQRGNRPTDPAALLARHGIDAEILRRVDRSPTDQVARWGQSPLGLRWRGRRTIADRLGPLTPLPGLYAAGAFAAPGAGVPFVGLSAALVAQALHPDAYR